MQEPEISPAQKSHWPRWIRAFSGSWSPRDLLLLAVCPLVGLVSAFASERLQSRDHVLPGVLLDGEDVSGYARSVLESRASEQQRGLSHQRLRVRVGKAVFLLNGADVGARRGNEALEQAMSAGRRGNVLGQVYWRLQRVSSFDEYSTALSLDDTLVEQHLHAFERAALPIPTEGSVTYVEGKVVATYPAAGETIDRRVAVQLLRRALERGDRGVELPSVGWSPTTTRAVVDDTKAAFERAVRAAVEMFVRSPEGYAQALTNQDGETIHEEQDETRVELVLPKVFGPVLQTRQRANHPSSLEIFVAPREFERVLVDVRKRWQRPAHDAVFKVDQRNRVTIEPSQAEWQLPSEPAIEAFEHAVLSAERRGVWQLVLGAEPEITTELAHKLNVTKLVGTFITHHPCCQPRVNNIHRIADLLNDTVVLPGEIFSVNETLGPRTLNGGFLAAPTIVAGEMDDTIGGGISQFATTLFNAVLRGGYEIIERQPHSVYFNRYPMGHEATLSFPKPDLVFKNDTQSGMVIKTTYSKTSIRVSVFGDNGGRTVKTEVSKPFDSVEPALEYIPDPELPPEEEKVEQKGDYGFTVFASRTVQEADGSEKKESRKVVYKARPRRLVVHPCKIPPGFDNYTGEKCPEAELADAGASGG
jgi:vancomycin resistance protein YoaR